MENNSDKIIREKLAGLQPHFEPQAWQQMEAMLNKNEKPKGFLFWWLGGIAFLLATGIVMYSALTVSNEQLSMNNEKTTINNKQLTVNNEPSSIESTVRSQQSAEINSETINQKQQTINNKQLPIEKSSDNREQTSENNSPTKNDKPKTINNEQSSTEKTTDNKPKTTNQKPKTKNEQLTASGNTGKETTSRKSSSAMNKSAEVTAMNNTTAVAETPHTVQHNSSADAPPATIAENNIAVNENASVATPDATTPLQETTAAAETAVAEAVVVEDSISTKEEKQPEETAEKLMKPAGKFHYSLGVASTVTATVTKGTLAPDPSYSIGFVNEFLFVNRVALSTGFNYSKTSYKMSDPNIEHSNTMPLELEANITELTIPLGVKVYPVSNNKFRYYVNTGIINHIKLQENFVYMLPAPDTSTNPNLPQTTNDPVFNYVPQTTNFGSTASEALFDANTIGGGGGGSSSSISNSDFSLNNAQRFYMSFYAATGVEFVIKKRLVIFAETLYFMNIHPLGVQDTRKHNFGMGSGIRVQF
jgi:hypothetical protein